MKKTQSPAQSGKPQDPEKKALMWRLLLHCLIILAIYFILVALHFEYIFHIYVGVGAVLGLSFVIYNRGFAAKGITPEMLPDTMSYEEKLAFIEDSKQRLHKSKWMLSVLFPIIFVFALDMMYLYLLPMLQETFG